jgi:hypothetical protein
MATRPRAVVLALATVAIAVTVGFWLSRSFHVTGPGLPATINDRAYWEMVVNFSERGGTFRSNGATRSDNLVSNEASLQHVIPDLQRVSHQGAYLGVGPEQNLTYISALKPAVAFVIDIRRGNLLLHLLYKALVEMSSDRVDFLSRLFSRPRPAGVGPDSTTAAIFAAFRTLSGSDALLQTNVHAVVTHLERTHGFSLSRQDEGVIESACNSFYLGGPDTRWDSSGAAWIPSYAELMTQTDRQGRPHSFLSSEASFLVLKEYEARNLIVPLVGDFAGDKTIRAVGRYLRLHGATVATFYTSNVEAYLFRADAWRRFLGNVSALPIDERSMLVRTRFTTIGYIGSEPEYETSTGLEPIQGMLRAFDDRRIRSYGDLLWRSKSPSP